MNIFKSAGEIRHFLFSKPKIIALQFRKKTIFVGLNKNLTIQYG